MKILLLDQFQTIFMTNFEQSREVNQIFGTIINSIRQEEIVLDSIWSFTLRRKRKQVSQHRPKKFVSQLQDLIKIFRIPSKLHARHGIPEIHFRARLISQFFN